MSSDTNQSNLPLWSKEAVAKYELAIRFDKTRISTRKKLIEVCRANGMEDMAATIQRVIEKMERENASEAAKTNEKDTK